MFAENENKDTPCDCAEKQHHKELALNLESRMVFSRDPEAESIEAEYAALDKKEVRGYFKFGIFYTFMVVAVTLCVFRVITFLMLSTRPWCSSHWNITKELCQCSCLEWKQL